MKPGRKAVSWMVNWGFDDVAVWHTIWAQEEHLVCCLSHAGRLVAYQTVAGKWREGGVATAQWHLRPVASARTDMVIRCSRQKEENRQRVTVGVRTRPLRLTYDSAMRRKDEGEQVSQDLWLVEVEILPPSVSPGS
jgi:hypothetical protein